LEAAAQSLGQRPLLTGDPGCLVTVADRLDAKYAIGSAIGVADGLSKAGVKERCVAVFGDSAFFHTALPALCNAVHNRSNILMVILDNQATATSGYQVNPGVGKDAIGRAVPALDIERIARVCGVPHINSCDLDAPQPALERTFKQALSQADLSMIIVRIKSRA
jgi:indolepyruvate ferredoxin oxidoreductase alpha subunit